MGGGPLSPAPCCPLAAVPACPPAEGLIQFLVTEKTFSEERIRAAIKRINDAKGKSSQGGWGGRVGGVATN